MRPVRSTLARAALAVASLSPAAACGVALLAVAPPASAAWDWVGKAFEETRQIDVPHVAGSSIEVASRNGGITVERREGATAVTIVAKVRARTQERLEAAQIIAERDAAGVLRVSVRWPDDKPQSNEGCSFEISVPDATGVTAKSANGAITIAGLAGDALLTTANGSVTVKGHDGPVDIETSNGAVRVSDVRGDADIETNNGSVQVDGVTGELDVETSNGAVDARLSDDSAGPVRIETSNGGVDLTVGKAFAGTLAMSTNLGSLRVTDGAGEMVKGKRRMKVRIGEGGSESSVTTSMGAISVRAAGPVQVDGAKPSGRDSDA